MPSQFDAIVVGARAAGSMTALHLSRLGHRVLVVDRTDPSSDTLSTHVLLRTAVLQLKRAGVLGAVVNAGTPPITSMTLGFGRKLIPVDVEPEHGVDALYAPRRTVLDPILLAAAVDAGAEVELGRSVTGLVRDGLGRVGGVVLGSGADAVTVTARVVVGADGRKSSIADMVGASNERFLAATAASIYAYYEEIESDGFDFRYGRRVSAGTVRTNDGLVLVSAGVPSQDLGATEETFHRALLRAAPDIADAVNDASRVGRFRFTPGIDSFLRVPAGPGWLLVGDAGFTMDPLSAHGISSALRDAELASEAIHTGLTEPSAEQAAGELFHSTRNRFAVPLLEHSAALASYDWDDDGASELMRALGRDTDAECDFLGRTTSSPRRVAA